MQMHLPSGLAPAVRAERRHAPVPVMPEEILDSCSLASLQLGGPTLRSLGITSAIRGEGRTTIALAMTLVQRQDYDRRPLLIEMDVEHPCLGRRLGLRTSPGLSEVVRGQATLDDAIQWIDGIRVVTAGASLGRPDRVIVELVASDVLSRLGEGCDVIIADLPAVTGCSFAALAAGTVASLLLVVRAGVTPAARIREAVADLPLPPAVLLNGTEPLRGERRRPRPKV